MCKLREHIKYSEYKLINSNYVLIKTVWIQRHKWNRANDKKRI